MKKIPSIKLPIIINGQSSIHVLSEITANKKIIILDMKLKIKDNALLSMIDATINEN